VQLLVNRTARRIWSIILSILDIYPFSEINPSRLVLLRLICLRKSEASRLVIGLLTISLSLWLTLKRGVLWFNSLKAAISTLIF
jgi:hypothetical protein